MQGFGSKAAGSKDLVRATKLFQAVWIGKPVAGTTMSRFVEQSKFALDTSINTYLKTRQLPVNEFNRTEAASLRRIISHSAYLNGHGYFAYTKGA